MSGFERLIELTIRAGSLEPRVDGSPVKSIGWPEVAAAMAYVPVESADLLRAVYLLDPPSAWRVHRRLMEALDRWPDVTGGSKFRYERLMDCIIGAFVNQRPCKNCGGAGHIWIPARTFVDMVTHKTTRTKAQVLRCEVCKGDGLDHVKRSAVQLAMGVDAEMWEDELEKPFAFAYALLLQWHEQGREGLTAALS